MKGFAAPAVSFVMLAAGMLMEHFRFAPFVSHEWTEFLWYLIAFLPVGLPVMKEAVEDFASRDFFNEFTLMLIASIGAFCIREWPEAVGVMLFYSVGEALQQGAVDRATRDISRLLDVRGESVRVVRGDKTESVSPSGVKVGETIEVRPGERVPLDGVLTGGGGVFDTSALTGESLPRDMEEGDEVLAGMISSQTTVRIRVTREYSRSALSRILDLVEHASGRKARTELFIRRFARVYTPTVIALAVLVVAVPALVSLFAPGFRFVFSDWLYRALVFLVISCPCALVVSVPLGYFAGIGAASRRGILFKGGNYLDAITRVDTIAFDKTGTLTTGEFGVVAVESRVMPEREMLSLLASVETGSSHPLAKALVRYAGEAGIEPLPAEGMTEKPGFGAVAAVGGRRVVAGNLRMLDSENTEYPPELLSLRGTAIVCAVDGRYCGYVELADTMRPDSREALDALRALGIDRTVMLSGDRDEIAREYASRLGIAEAHGGLLPQDKAEYVAKIASMPGRSIAFVGDGMNDAPVLALSDVGIAMGGLGSDAAIESADVVIQTDAPSRIATAIRIGRTTRTIVKENIVGAIGIKAVILLLGAMGFASLWAAVFADVGVALLAVLNSMRILWKRY